VDTDLPHGYGQARKWGLSSQQLCIAIGIDVFKNPYAVVCGHRKPSTRKIRDAFGGHIAKGALVVHVVVHERERAHSGVIRDAGAIFESYKVDVRDQEYLESMELANNLCSWLKRYLWRFTGMSHIQHAKATSTDTSTCSVSTRQATGDRRLQGWCAI
jgi:hypothetical protein